MALIRRRRNSARGLRLVLTDQSSRSLVPSMDGQRAFTPDFRRRRVFGPAFTPGSARRPASRPPPPAAGGGGRGGPGPKVARADPCSCTGRIPLTRNRVVSDPAMDTSLKRQIVGNAEPRTRLERNYLAVKSPSPYHPLNASPSAWDWMTIASS